VTVREKIRVISFWALMVALALVWVKLNARDGESRADRILDFAPLMGVIVLFAWVWSIDRLLRYRTVGSHSNMRSGIGYDLHRLAPGRKLMIGGIEVPFDKGSVGHSDGDVLAHALCDALLGAASLGDIGTHFPDTDPKWKGASSLLFLEHTRKLLDERKLRISHLDAVVICERPKLGPHFPAMRAALAKSLGIAEEQINLKAKTNEGTGEIGRGEAIAAHTIATLEG
jgi:2-C-methyl-D-erythritol 2,4-cyclodiphosphate synthase